MNKYSGIRSNFSKITIGIASPESILKRSHGEVVNSKTINYKTHKVEQGGILCETIFGPTKNFECYCGKYRGYEYYGMICDVCGTEIVEKSVRRDRCGHVELAIPVANPCFFKQNPSPIGVLLDLTHQQLEDLIYYEKYIIIQPGIYTEKGIQARELITIDEYNEIINDLPEGNMDLPDSDPNKFIALTGSQSLYYLLKNLDVNDLYFSLKEKINSCNEIKKSDYLRKLDVVRNFVSFDGNVKNKPEWMIFKVLPIIPAGLRPADIIGGQVVSVDLNELYRHIIIRNNRLKSLLEINAPEVVLRHEKRMLQDAVDELIEGASTQNTQNTKKLKSLVDLIKGKEGRFRQNLLGKRVDYSGRSVIVVNPKLKISECGLSKNMAVEIFKPFILNKLIDRQIVRSVVDGEVIIKRKDPVIYEILENLLPGFPVLLNRAPSLHRMSIQAFQPKLIEDNVIQLSPLVCAQFNADFDGDQMGIHVPLFTKTKEEAALLVLSSNNLFKSADSMPAFVPNMEIILGIYYLTQQYEDNKTTDDKNLVLFSSIDELIYAVETEKISIHDNIKIRLLGKNLGKDNIKIIETTAGRCIFNNCLPNDFEFINEAVTSTKIKEIVKKVVNQYKSTTAITIIDKLKDLGFKYSYKSGISFKINDLKVPLEKTKIIKQAEDEINTINYNYDNGFISEKERLDQIISIWMRAVNIKMMMATMKSLNDDVNKNSNSVLLMLKSGARGSKGQILQTCGMRGLMSRSRKSSSDGSSIIEIPIKSNFKEGLSVLEYFVSTNGGRKGMTDTALKTAEAGYLTRKLVDVAQNIIIKEFDCGTNNFITIKKFDDYKNSDSNSKIFKKSLIGKVAANDVIYSVNNEVIVKKNELITEDIADKIEECNIYNVPVRSILTCKCKEGICSLCYGKSLGFNTIAQEGEPVGIIAAQSIGEPGTQLTLNTFHVGGVANSSVLENSKVAHFDGIAHFTDLQTVSNNGNDYVIVSFCKLAIIQKDTKIIHEIIQVPYGAMLKISENSDIKKGDVLFEIDPYSAVIIATEAGKIEFKNFDGNIEFRKDENKSNKSYELVVNKVINNNKAFLILHTKNKKIRYGIYNKSRILVKDGEKVEAGTFLIKNPRKVVLSSDITGGLPKVTGLFEVKNIQNAFILSDIDGVVSLGNVVKNSFEIIVTSNIDENISYKYLIPTNRDILVQEGDFVKCGSQLCTGDTSISEIFKTKGFFCTCSTLTSELKSVYELQGISIADKHLEIIIRQMFSFVEIVDAGDSSFIEGELIKRTVFEEENKRLYKKNIITEIGDSQVYKKGMFISNVDLFLENFKLEKLGLKKIAIRQSSPARGKISLLGISQVALNSSSFLSAASFQFTVNVLLNSAMARRTDYLSGIKENIVVGKKIPAGTGFENFSNVNVKSTKTTV